MPIYNSLAKCTCAVMLDLDPSALASRPLCALMSHSSPGRKLAAAGDLVPHALSDLQRACRATQLSCNAPSREIKSAELYRGATVTRTRDVGTRQPSGILLPFCRPNAPDLPSAQQQKTKNVLATVQRVTPGILRIPIATPCLPLGPLCARGAGTVGRAARRSANAGAA